MKFLKNQILKLNLKGILCICTIVMLSFIPLLMTKGKAATPPISLRGEWGSVHIVETTYAGAVEVPDWLTTQITNKYGAKAAEIYDQCVSTGDYVPYRQYTGYWKEHSVANDFTVNTCGVADSYDRNTVSWLGVYATIQDYINWCQVNGYNPVGDNNKMGQDYASGKLKDPAKITKAQYQKNHAAQAQAAANQAADASKVEALKTYKGNTAEFNAYNYYSRYADLQAAIGPNGDALLKHYNEFGKAEGRNAK